MKKLFLLFVLIGILFYVDDSEAIVCCDLGCFNGNVCCGDTGQTQGYVGCFDPNDNQYKCPGEAYTDPGDAPTLGQCLVCGECYAQRECAWVQGVPTDNCPTCNIFYSTEQGLTELPIDSLCLGTGGGCSVDEDCEFGECVEDEYGDGLVCSTDSDEDGIYDINDFCVAVFDEANEDEDNDCFSEGEKSSLFGVCGDSCDVEELCNSVYTQRQCCDDFVSASGDGEFHGYFADCPDFEGSLGCYDFCFSTDVNGCEVNYDVSSCIDGVRTVTETVDCNGVESIGETREESCEGLPLIPFFTIFNVFLSGLILVGYYSIKRSSDVYY